MKKAFLQLHIAVFLAGFTGILGKLILLNEGLLVWWRLLIAIVVLAVMMIIRRELVTIAVKDFFKIAGVGFLVAFHWVAFYGSIKYSNISVALVCFSATGFFTALFEPLILKKKLVPAELIFGMLAIAGIYIIFDFHPQYEMGILFGILSAVGSAIFPIFNKILLQQFNARVLSIYEFTGGLLALCILLPFYFIYFKPAYYLPSDTDWGWLLLLSVVCTVIMFELQLNALRKVSAFTVSLSYNLEPVYGILLAFLIFQENKTLQPQFYIGLILIMASILLHMVRVLRNHKKTL